jgi:hypothetical protein
VRFRPPRPRQAHRRHRLLQGAGGALTGDQERQLFVDCCDEILRRDPDTARSARSTTTGRCASTPATSRWGDDVETARECVAKLYNLDKQPLALAGPPTVIIDWLQGIDAEIAARVEGGKSRERRREPDRGRAPADERSRRDALPRRRPGRTPADDVERLVMVLLNNRVVTETKPLSAAPRRGADVSDDVVINIRTRGGRQSSQEAARSRPASARSAKPGTSPRPG